MTQIAQGAQVKQMTQVAQATLTTQATQANDSVYIYFSEYIRYGVQTILCNWKAHKVSLALYMSFETAQVSFAFKQNDTCNLCKRLI